MPSTRGYRRSRSLYEVWPPSNCDPGRGKQQDGGRWAPPQPRGAAGAQDPQVEGYPRPTRWAPYESCEDPESSCAGQCVGVGARRGGRTLLTTCHTGAAGKETACRGGPALHAIQLASALSRASQQRHAHPDNSGMACRDSGTALDTSNTPLAESVPHSAQPQLVLSLAKPLRHSKLRAMVKEVTADPPVLSAAGPCPLASPSALSTQPLAPSMGQGASGTQR